jgi:hypothetical protein
VSIPGARTTSQSVGFERSYVGHVTFEQAACLIVSGDEGIAGVTDPQLEPPIDFEGELEKRERDRVPVDEVADSDTSNGVFGI